MKTTKTLRWLLGLAGGIASGLGAWILAAPVAFHAGYGTQLGSNPNLLSEVRAPGGALFALGLYFLAGVVRPNHARPAAQVAVLTYGAYGLSRLVSLQQDGVPSAALIAAAGIELVLAGACAWALAREQRIESASKQSTTPRRFA